MTSRRDILATLIGIWLARARPSYAAGKLPPPPGSPRNGQVRPAFDAKGNVLDSWWAGLPLNQWVEVIGTDFVSHVTPLLPPGYRDFGVSGLVGVFHAWCGAAIDRATGRMWFSGGGHQDSANNGVYEFTLEKMAWRVAMQPSIYTPEDVAHSKASWNANGGWGGWGNGYDYPNDYWNDGKPCAVHTYRGLEWCPDNGKIVKLYKHFWQIDPVNGKFVRGAATAWISENSLVYDPVGRKFYCFFIDAHNYWSYRIYDPLADTVSAKLGFKGQTHITSAQLPLVIGRKIYLVAGSPPFTFDLDTGALADLPGGSHPALYKQTGDYSSNTGKIYAMNAPTGPWGSFSVLDTATGTWSQFTPSGAPPVPGGLPAPYTKFRIYERANGTFMVLFHVANANLRIVRIADTHR